MKPDGRANAPNSTNMMVSTQHLIKMLFIYSYENQNGGTLGKDKPRMLNVETKEAKNTRFMVDRVVKRTVGRGTALLM